MKIKNNAKISTIRITAQNSYRFSITCRINNVNKLVLLLSPNPFSSPGSGATRVYKKIIEKNPEIKFFFSVKSSEFSELSFPDNCFPIQVDGDFSVFKLLEKVYGYNFDFIDIPDYLTLQPNPVKILNRFRIKYSKIVLALHGSPTKTEFKSRSYRYFEFVYTYYFEKIMVLSADYVYGISSHYCKTIILKKRSYIISPDELLPVRESQKNNMNTKSTASREKIVITYIGRQEKVKGIYLYLKLIRELDSNKYEFEIIGPLDSRLGDHLSVESLKIFSGKNIRERVLSEDEVTNLYTQRNRIFVILSEFESFSLVALDAIHFSANVIINKESGIIKSIPTEDLPNLFTFEYKRNESDTIHEIKELLNKIQMRSEDFYNRGYPRIFPKSFLNKRQKLVEGVKVYEF